MINLWVCEKYDKSKLFFLRQWISSLDRIGFFEALNNGRLDIDVFEMTNEAKEQRQRDQIGDKSNAA